MVIRKLNASFGKLNNETISFHDGLNVISMPNESGKSTWCAFIKAMLYGVDSSERQKVGHIPEKQKFAPWSGSPMEGTMEIECGKESITLTRTTRLKNAPMREFSATYTGTAQVVEGLNGSNAGELLTGVSKDVFSRSAFVEQGAAAVTGSTELEKRINALCSSGEEDVSFSEADDRLRAWQRKRKYLKKGMIPESEDAIREKEEQLKDIDSCSTYVFELERKEKDCQSQVESLEADVTRARREQRERLISQMSEARDEVRSLGNKQNASLDALNEAKDEMRRSTLGLKKESEVVVQGRNDISEIQSLSSVNQKRISLVFSVILFVLSLASAVLYQHYYKIVPLAIAAGLLCAGAVALLSIYLKGRRQNLDAQERIKAILKKYEAADTEEIKKKIENHSKMCKQLYELAGAYKAVSDEYDDAVAKLEKLESRFMSEEDESDASILSRRLSELRKSQTELSLKIASEKGRLVTMGDPLVLRGDIQRLKEEKEELTQEYDAINLALEALREADNEMQLRFSPHLGEKAAEYMSKMTGGRYEEILLNKDFSAKAKTRDDAVARESGYLSAGTADLLYLAVRLAICDLALPMGENCPLIIDDALVNLDNERYNQATRLLLDIAKERQVILFTCRNQN